MKLVRGILALAFLATACAWTPAFTQLRAQRPAAAAASPVPVMFGGSRTASKPKKTVVRKTVVKKPPARVAGAKKPVVRKPIAKKAPVKKAGDDSAPSGLAALSALFAPKSVVARPAVRAAVRKPVVKKPVVRAAVKPYVRPKPVVRKAAPKPYVRPKPVVRKPVAKPVVKKVLPRGA